MSNGLDTALYKNIPLRFQKKEREFDDYLHEKFVQAKADFRELLKETKLITYRSHAMIEVTEQHFKDIEKILEVLIYNKRSLFTINFINSKKIIGKSSQNIPALIFWSCIRLIYIVESCWSLSFECSVHVRDRFPQKSLGVGG